MDSVQPPALSVSNESFRRGSMVLVTEECLAVGPLRCEMCNAQTPGGTARGVIVQEQDGSETPWRLWVLADGWSTTDKVAGSMAVCPTHQQVPVIKSLRFAAPETQGPVDTAQSVFPADSTYSLPLSKAATEMAEH